MTDTILTLIHGAIVLFYGVFLSGAFSGIKPTRSNIIKFTAVSIFCGTLQTVFAIIFSTDTIWMLYPLIVHLPLILFLCFVYHKRFATAIASVCTAYLCCHPSKWFGILAFYISQNGILSDIVRIVSLIAVFPLILFFISPVLADIFSKDKRDIYIFSIAPLVYYFYDYITVVYTDLLADNNIIATEFLPFFMLVVYIIMCLLYYRENQQKADAERKEHIIGITLEEQKKELDAIRNSELEIRLLRHDMRLLLNNISVCIDNNDKDTAKKLISSYVDSIDATAVKKYCCNTTINYIISSFDKRCSEKQIKFGYQIDIDHIDCDEIMLSSIISNALDNALNAQGALPADIRSIKFMLKKQNGKLLISVKNPFSQRPVFSDGVPVSRQKGHGLGTQSIVFLTERMGGNCQFTTENNTFVLRVII